MSDAVRAFVARQGLGRIERLVRLRAGALCLTADGLWVVSAESDEKGTAIDLLERDDVRYRVGRLTDALRYGDHELGVPAGKGESAPPPASTATASTDPTPASPGETAASEPDAPAQAEPGKTP